MRVTLSLVLSPFSVSDSLSWYRRPRLLLPLLLLLDARSLFFLPSPVTRACLAHPSPSVRSARTGIKGRRRAKREREEE